MANWFIALPVQVEGVEPIPEPPPRVRLFSAADRHCTIAFLGPVGASQARIAWERVGDLFAPEGPKSGSFEALRPLGNPRKPSALAAIVREGREELGALIARTRAPLLEAAGAAPDDRDPLPHVTLGRIQRRASGSERRAALAWAATVALGSTRFAADSVALYTWSEDRSLRLFDRIEEQRLVASGG